MTELKPIRLHNMLLGVLIHREPKCTSLGELIVEHLIEVDSSSYCRGEEGKTVLCGRGLNAANAIRGAI
jgi:hypothetical protein